MIINNKIYDLINTIDVNNIEVEYFDTKESKYYDLETNHFHNKHFKWTSKQFKFKINNLYKNSIKLVFENNPVNELITVLFSNKSETFILNKNEIY